MGQDHQDSSHQSSLAAGPPLRRTNPEISFALEAASLLERLHLFERLHLCGFCRRRIDLRDLAKAIGLGVVRPGDERAAHFRAVPSGSDAKPKRLFDLNVAGRKILHRGSLSRWRSTIERCQFLADWRSRLLLSYRWRAGQNPKVRPRPGRDDGCRPERARRRINSARSAPSRPPPPRKWPESIEGPSRARPAARAGLVRCSPPPPERA